MFGWAAPTFLEEFISGFWGQRWGSGDGGGGFFLCQDQWWMVDKGSAKGAGGGIAHSVDVPDCLGVLPCHLVEGCTVLLEPELRARFAGVVVHADLKFRPGPAWECASLGMLGGEGDWEKGNGVVWGILLSDLGDPSLNGHSVHLGDVGDGGHCYGVR